MYIDQKIAQLRKIMKAKGIDAYLIPSSDPHNSEYVADRWMSRTWISGFNGSAGTVIITQDHAGLWTDSRYFLQAEQELEDSEFVLHKMVNQFKAYHLEWLNENLNPSQTLGYDGSLVSKSYTNTIKSTLKDRRVEVITIHDLMDEIWKDRPGLPSDKIYEHDVKFAGKTRTQKLDEVRSQMGSASYYLTTALDEIAWLLNLRGRDVDCNPVFIAYAVIGKEKCHLFVDESKISPNLKEKLSAENIVLHPYRTILDTISNVTDNKKIILDAAACNTKLYNSIDQNLIIQKDSIIKHLKAIKNPTEVAHFRKVMVKDGIALCHAFYWLEQALADGEEVKEYQFADKIAYYRSQEADYVGESFGAIIGYNAHGAVIHYHPTPESSKTIKQEGILLCDSGGQYLDGTTDITRTIALSSPTKEQQKHYTLVLKGHISLDKAVFPEGTNGGQLDILARQFLWNEGLNYLHGTGHGVGFFMNVHEPPQGFASPVSERGKTPHLPGMITTNEPGFYKDGEYGIRIENILHTRQHSDGYLSHENLTLFPIDTTLIDFDLMSTEETTWLNDYHQRVYDTLSPKLDDAHKSWMKEKCKMI